MSKPSARHIPNFLMWKKVWPDDDSMLLLNIIEILLGCRRKISGLYIIGGICVAIPLRPCSALLLKKSTDRDHWIGSFDMRWNGRESAPVCIQNHIIDLVGRKIMNISFIISLYLFFHQRIDGFQIFNHHSFPIYFSHLHIFCSIFTSSDVSVHTLSFLSFSPNIYYDKKDESTYSGWRSSSFTYIHTHAFVYTDDCVSVKTIFGP